MNHYSCTAGLRLALVPMIVLGAAGCSLKHITVDQTAAILKDASGAFARENDLELAAAAIPASVKTIEGFLEAHPRQRILLRLLAENYMSYAFGFLEDDAEVIQEDDPDGAEHLRARALNLHLRARDFGLRLLELDHPALAATLRARRTPTAGQLQQLWTTADLEGLFWTANPWAAAINVGKSDPALVAEVPLVKTLLQRCVALDPGYYWGGAHLVLGGMEAAIPAALGGRVDAAKQHFQEAIELSHGHHLMTQVIYARAAGVQAADRELFARILKKVLATDPDVEPSLGLANRLAQRRAQRYLSQIDDLFL